MASGQGGRPAVARTTVVRWIVILAVAGLAVGTWVLRPAAPGGAAGDETATPATTAALPRLVDLGADRCVPCKMMAPILAELETEYAGRLDVQFIDVWKNPDAGEPYGIKLIPTQIFLAADGTELFRHEGFFAKDDILAKWRELGVTL